MESLRKWALLLVAPAAAGLFGYQYWLKLQTALPDGIASGNGRLEAKLVDASAKEPLRVKEILVDEGSLVRPGQVMVRLDTVTLDAQLAEAKASVATTREQVAVANAAIVRAKSEIALAKIEVERFRKLVPSGAVSRREFDFVVTKLETTTASLAEEEARLAAANEQVEVAQAQVATIRTRIADATLVSPVTGRVLYRLAEPGEVLGPGGKALTIVNLEDVYMEIFLPAEQAASLSIGAEARITVDHDAGREVAAFVSFVSPEAQFTPKEVETKTEREKLMFRVKIQVPKELVGEYIERVKTGVRGVGYVKYNESASWPAWLDDNLLTVPRRSGPLGESAGAGR